MFMQADKAIKMHLSLFTQADKNMTLFSGFIAALRDARKFTARDQETGQKISGQSFGDLGSWLGAIGYIVLLDQIGSCFKPISAATVSENTITKALKYFSTLPEKEIDAIYALRCAFAHDYSLYNINRSKPSLTHHFKVHQSPTFPLVKLPQQQWDGDYTNMNDRNKTTINLEALGDLVETICAQLFALASQNDLEVTLIGGTDELLQRYSFYSSNKMKI